MSVLVLSGEVAFCPDVLLGVEGRVHVEAVVSRVGVAEVYFLVLGGQLPFVLALLGKSPRSFPVGGSDAAALSLSTASSPTVFLGGVIGHIVFIETGAFSFVSMGHLNPAAWAVAA